MERMDSVLPWCTPGRKVNNPKWCCCFECEVLCASSEAYFCCRNNRDISFLRGENCCITNHDSFECVVTNLDTLSTARYVAFFGTGTQKYKAMIENRNNRVWRHFAYKQFINWVTSWSPNKRIRIVLPSCVVRKIREAFPDEYGYYEDMKVTAMSEPDYFD